MENWFMSKISALWCHFIDACTINWEHLNILSKGMILLPCERLNNNVPDRWVKTILEMAGKKPALSWSARRVVGKIGFRRIEKLFGMIEDFNSISFSHLGAGVVVGNLPLAEATEKIAMKFGI
jgi:hypothetical protein